MTGRGLRIIETMTGMPVVEYGDRRLRQRSGLAAGRADAADRQAKDADYRAQRDRYFPCRSRALRRAKALFHAGRTARSNSIRRNRWNGAGPIAGDGAGLGYFVRDILGHSAIADYALSKFSFDFWYGNSKQIYRRVAIPMRFPSPVRCCSG